MVTNIRNGAAVAAMTLLVFAGGEAGAQGVPFVRLGVSCDTHDVMADTAGRVHAIWVEGRTVHYGRIENETIAGQEDVPGSNGVTMRFTRPRIAMKPDGSEIHTAWVTPDPESDSMVHAWRDATGWHTHKVWERSGDEHLAQPSIAVRPDGSVHVIAQRWRDNVGPSPIVYYAKTAGGAWQSPVEISPNDAEYRDTAMIADPAGGLHAAWKAAHRPGYYAYAPPGAGFGETIEVPKRPGVATVSFGDLFVDGAGTVHHAFAVYGNNVLAVDYSFLPKNGAFSASERVSETDQVSVTSYDHWPAVAADRLGRVYVSWGEESGGTVKLLKYAVLEAKQWTRGDVETDADIHNFGKPSLAVTTDAVHLVWRTSGGELALLTVDVAAQTDGGVADAGADAGPADGGGGDTGTIQDGGADAGADAGSAGDGGTGTDGSVIANDTGAVEDRGTPAESDAGGREDDGGRADAAKTPPGVEEAGAGCSCAAVGPTSAERM
jgi:hypothetical protein